MPAYRRMTRDDRLVLEKMYNAGYPVREIAAALGFAPKSVYREIKIGLYEHLNHDYTTCRKYSAERGQRAMLFNRTTKGARLKIEHDHAFIRTVEHLIVDRKLSPDAALAAIRRENLPVTRVCTRTLYSYIDKGLFLHITNKDLPYRGSKRKHHRATTVAKTAPKGTSIDRRPASVSSRKEFGHWELDSVIGARAKGETLLVFTERMTRFELILRARDKTAASTVRALDRIERAIGAVPFRAIFKTITCDNGCEFADTEGLERSCRSSRHRTSFFYCHPYCSSERGSNENQNRIIRRFVKKGTAIKGYSDECLAAVQRYINDLPRRMFQHETSAERFEHALSKIGLKKYFNFFYLGG